MNALNKHQNAFKLALNLIDVISLEINGMNQLFYIK